MDKHMIGTVVLVALLCGFLGFLRGRHGTVPADKHEAYCRAVNEGIRKYSRYYTASRQKTKDLFDYIATRKRFFYQDMPASWKTAQGDPQCVVDLFGNLDIWKADYEQRTKSLDTSFPEIEAQIKAAEIHRNQ